MNWLSTLSSPDLSNNPEFTFPYNDNVHYLSRVNYTNVQHKLRIIIF